MIFLNSGAHYLRSYPTYEEWKLFRIIATSIRKRSSYPTYEEWKLKKFPFQDLKGDCSYPTYEEWKLAE